MTWAYTFEGSSANGISLVNNYVAGLFTGPGFPQCQSSLRGSPVSVGRHTSIGSVGGSRQEECIKKPTPKREEKIQRSHENIMAWMEINSQSCKKKEKKRKKVRNEHVPLSQGNSYNLHTAVRGNNLQSALDESWGQFCK